MDLTTFQSSLQTSFGEHLPSVLGAIAILALGWLVAVILRAGVRRLLRMTHLNQHIASSTEQSMDVESGVAAGVFWLILLLALVAAFNVLGMQGPANPLGTLTAQILDYLPHLLAGTVLALAAWLLALVLRGAVTKLLAATAVDDKLAAEAGMAPMSRSVANVLFWLVILLFLPAVLGAYQLTGLLEPVEAMLAKSLDMVPNVFAALVIGVVGWLVAKILRALVVNLLAAGGADGLGTRMGLAESVKLSRLAGTLVFIFVFVPSLIAALDALQVEAISGPATDMLHRFLAVVPDLVAAALILTLTWYVARFASDLVARLLEGMGFNTLPARLGTPGAFAGELTPARLVGKVLLFFAMLFAAIEAADQLGFGQVSDVLTTFLRFGGDLLLGGTILVVGYWLADLAYKAIDRASGEHTTGLAGIARFAILGLVLAMGLRAMGIADDIVDLAFGLTLGAIAVAVALSFGLGGREAAGKLMDHWLSRYRKE